MWDVWLWKNKAIDWRNFSGISMAGDEDPWELHPFFVWQSPAGAAKLSVREISCQIHFWLGENHKNNQGKVILLLQIYFFSEEKTENWDGMIPLMVLWVVWGCLQVCWVLLSVFKEQTPVLVCYYHFLQSRSSSELSLAAPGRKWFIGWSPWAPSLCLPIFNTQHENGNTSRASS